MKKVVALLGLFLVSISGAFAQGTDCSTADPFCTGTTYTFNNNTGNADGGAYDCLGSTPNQAWYYLQIANSGPITINIAQDDNTGTGIDVDFACWGPFTNLTNACATDFTTTSTVDCSYSTAAVENCTIPNAQAGEWFMLLLTNYADVPGTITFSQSGGTGSTNCNILCNITSVTAVATACDSLNNTYSVSGTIVTSNPPNAGTLTITNSCGGTPEVINTPFSTTYNYSFTNLSSNGAACQINAAYSADPTCLGSANYSAPASCQAGPVCTATAANSGPYCIGGTIDLNATPAGALSYAWTGPNGYTGSGVNPQISNVTATNAGAYTVVVTMPDSAVCTATTNVVVNVIPPPTVSNVFYCPSTTANPLTATATAGGTLNWWGTNSTGGTSSATAPTPSTAVNGTTDYYVSQTVGACESPRAMITVTIGPLPPPVVTTNVTYCLNTTASPLTAVGVPSSTLNWYGTDSIGGTASATPPTPTTNVADTIIYYVSQTVSGCESPRAPLAVITTNPPAGPLTTNATYCQNDVSTALVATALSGNTLNWYGTNATGGTASATAPVPSTTAAGVTTYYVSQSNGNCEGPRSPITVTVNPAPAVTFTASDTISCVPLCVNFADQTSALCYKLDWNFGDGSVDSVNNPQHCYSNVGTYAVSVRCITLQGCTTTYALPNDIHVIANPNANFTVSPSTIVNVGNTVTFHPADTVSANIFAWNFDDIGSGINNVSLLENPSHVYGSAGTYCVDLLVTQIAVPNCTDTNTVCVQVIPEPAINIPNVFTPNNDYKNDVLNFVSTGMTDLKCATFDRWGLKVYEFEGVNGFWDGRKKGGNDCSAGTYYFIVTYTDVKGVTTEKSGYVQLMREKETN